jgi:hypothetical protein
VTAIENKIVFFGVFYLRDLVAEELAAEGGRSMGSGTLMNFCFPLSIPIGLVPRLFSFLSGLQSTDKLY